MSPPQKPSCSQFDGQNVIEGRNRFAGEQSSITFPNLNVGHECGITFDVAEYGYHLALWHVSHTHGITFDVEEYEYHFALWKIMSVSVWDNI